MTQFILALAAALAIITAGTTAKVQATSYPGTIAPSEVHLPDPV
jgi:hypothetical protein